MTHTSAFGALAGQPIARPGPPGVRLWGLVPCAGSGTRALAPGAAAGPKQYRPVAGQPLVLHTLAAFAGVARLAGTLVAVAPSDTFFDRHPHPAYFAVPCGGATRADSVLGGLQALAERGAQPDDWVLVHDAARCLVTTALINQLIDTCLSDSVGGLLAHKLADTLKTASDGPGGVRVLATVDRSDKWLAQTPQMFRLGALRQALQQVGAAATDEASAIEATGLRPRLVEGGAQNFKVTYPEDFALAEAVLAQRLHGATVARFGGAAGEAARGADTAVFFSRPGS
ncbi:2-C-methyl-D-erythritol 4-phosphate cytidylyltransferase [Oryzisolibacter propanilivorax]|uniref:2-C-methyl-D-erythritol 4-phosphate cytidylyltransferase n=1 Tax=Oryzisolibacter propanilivorax TaxID=1527607 RepID=A0A1G9PFP9_9BURK|nr:2-C-methyl-D-erythritol 4-phosphate cytidylyltransferase [Oryzisolibacter propanilivorax]SDL97588.1 2-C-methyl-D-erythritol 4-phosphate cytidylyltransferase [Oryzisolibacter propanilivorax]